MLGGVSTALANTCTYYPGSADAQYTLPLPTANISVGADIPVGTVLYRMQAGNTTALRPWWHCTTDGGKSFNVLQYLTLSNTPALVPNWTGRFAGKLYQTSVAGIGIAFVNADGYNAGQDSGALSTSPFLKYTIPIPENIDWQSFYANTMYIHFVKTGPVSGGVINGANLPTVTLTANSDAPTTGMPLTPLIYNFSGSMNVIATSCTTPDVTVNLGKHETNTFNAIGAASPWVGFNIALQNCPPMYGSYPESTSPPTGFNDQTTAPGTVVQNSITLGFTPAYGIENAAQGIFKINPATGNATGVGIQLARGSSNNNPPLVNLAQLISQSFASTSNQNFTLPFQARYIQTASKVTPGPADGRATFTINYY
ncbi:fimbrial protein [Ewingella americana]|uniref:Fimbrial adhesin n=2 Tax=Ewingella americana TaxID=41202 RepID=A0A085GHQ5_EWIA3|nr:fimbrial protein [Ewingella americana]KFC83250.1 fimbrial adhesin [Ewingella americana ATCC 33852]